ncbi:hypothetical protein ONZ45_g17303 [Pleurotus djamor]|nr:hypothetical protein ONZ45_g17303 [Pleurotus djamor]
MLALGSGVSIFNPAGPSSTIGHTPGSSTSSTPTNTHPPDWSQSLGSPFYQPEPRGDQSDIASSGATQMRDHLMSDESAVEDETIPMDQDSGSSVGNTPPPENNDFESSDHSSSDDISDQDRPATRREFATLSSVLGDVADAVHSSVQILESIRDSGLRPPGRQSSTARPTNTARPTEETEENYDGDSELDEPRLTRLPKRRTQNQNELAALIREISACTRASSCRELITIHHSTFLRSEKSSCGQREARSGLRQMMAFVRTFALPRLLRGTVHTSRHLPKTSRMILENYMATKKTIRKAFTAHLRSLRRSYERKQLSEDALAAIKEQDTRAQRKRNVSRQLFFVVYFFAQDVFIQLYERRLRICQSNGSLRRHEKMIMRLGVDGMSSDESDHAQSLAQYRILIPRWRNPVLAQWLRTMDWVYYSTRFSMKRRAGQGSRPRLRITTMQYSDSSTYVPGLPKSAYDQEWYERLPEVFREAVDAKDTPYDFSHDQQITLLALQNNGAPNPLLACEAATILEDGGHGPWSYQVLGSVTIRPWSHDVNSALQVARIDQKHLRTRANPTMLPKCAICMDNFEESSSLGCLFNCGHVFCQSCTEKLFEDEDDISCPTCKALVMRDDSKGTYCVFQVYSGLTQSLRGLNELLSKLTHSKALQKEAEAIALSHEANLESQNEEIQQRTEYISSQTSQIALLMQELQDLKAQNRELAVEAGSSRVQISALKTERTKIQAQFRAIKGKARKRSLEPDDGNPSSRKNETKETEPRHKVGKRTVLQPLSYLVQRGLPTQGNDISDVQEEEEVANIFTVEAPDDLDSDEGEEEEDWEGSNYEEAVQDDETEDDKTEDEDDQGVDNLWILGLMITAAKQYLHPSTVIIVLLLLSLFLAMQRIDTDLSPPAVPTDVPTVFDSLDDLRRSHESSVRTMEQALATVEKHISDLDRQGDMVVQLSNVLPFLGKVTAMLEARVTSLETQALMLRTHLVTTDVRTTNLERRAGNTAYEEMPGYVEYHALWEWMQLQHYFWRIDQHPDLALLSAGARIDATMTTSTLMIRIPVPSFYGVSIRHIFGNPPETILSPAVANGNCWAFAGSHGQIAIRMARIAQVRSIVVEHVPKAQAFDLNTAPKDIEVWGVTEADEYEARRIFQGVSMKEDMVSPVKMGSFRYDIYQRHTAQLFPLSAEFLARNMDVSTVILVVMTNWGHPGFTCLYRVRIHGDITRPD